MRVLHIDSGREMHGGQWQALRLALGMVAAGHEAPLLCPETSPLFRLAREHNLAVSPLKFSSLFARADIVHAHDARSHSLAVFRSPLPCPLVVTRRVIYPVRRGWLSRWKYARLSHIIAISHAVKQELLRARIPQSKITVIYDGVPVPAEPAHGDRIVAPAKSATLLGPLCHRVHISTDLARDLPRARLLVYLSESEGLGSAALLAMAAGVPVVASDVGGLREIVEHNVTGILTANDPASVSSAIDAALANPSLGANARRAVEQRFTDAIMIEETVRLYRRLLD